MTTEEIRQELADRNVRFVRKDRSWLMRAIGWFLMVTFINQRFMTDYFTVIGKRTIYYPTKVTQKLELGEGIERFRTTLEHELVHMRQRDKWKILWQISWVLLPLPFLLAWCRWRWEREAYLTNIRNGTPIDWCVNALWAYGWPWPKPWMRKWFEEHAPSAE
jgi:hypothetical protein